MVHNKLMYALYLAGWVFNISAFLPLLMAEKNQKTKGIQGIKTKAKG